MPKGRLFHIRHGGCRPRGAWKWSTHVELEGTFGARLRPVFWNVNFHSSAAGAEPPYQALAVSWHQLPDPRLGAARRICFHDKAET
jgi:hypothetical protein